VDAEAPDVVQVLQRQVATLQAENTALRQQVQALEAQLV
jgi:cell division protein FtsB